MNQKSGYVLVPNDKIIDHCSQTLTVIRRKRAEMRRKYIDRYMKNADWWWRNVWKYFGFAKPTIKEALEALEFRNIHRIWSESDEINLHAAIQERECSNLMEAAKINVESTIMVSAEALRYCNCIRTVDECEK